MPLLIFELLLHQFLIEPFISLPLSHQALLVQLHATLFIFWHE